jgi:hypothetical protein
MNVKLRHETLKVNINHAVTSQNKVVVVPGNKKQNTTLPDENSLP